MLDEKCFDIEDNKWLIVILYNLVCICNYFYYYDDIFKT